MSHILNNDFHLKYLICIILSFEKIKRLCQLFQFLHYLLGGGPCV